MASPRNIYRLRGLTLTLLQLLLAASSLLSTAAAELAGTKPNILVLFADGAYMHRR